MGPHRHRCESGPGRRGVCRACVAGAVARRVELVRGRSGRSARDGDRLEFRGSRQPLRRHWRALPLRPRGVWPVRELRDRLDRLAHSRHELGLGRQRARERARLLLAGPYDGRSARDADVGRHSRHHGAQHPRDPAKLAGPERAHHRQTDAARAVHPDRIAARLVRGAAPGGLAGVESGPGRGAAADLRLWRLRDHSRAGRRGARSRVRPCPSPW